jgi:hypothetical protein
LWGKGLESRGETEGQNFGKYVIWGKDTKKKKRREGKLEKVLEE